MTVYTTNLVIHTGTDFEQTFVFEDDMSNSALNLTGYSGCARLKKFETSSPAASFTVSVTNIELGKVKIALSAATTINLRPGTYFYDLLLNNGTKVTRVIEGQAIVKKAVTRI